MSGETEKEISARTVDTDHELFLRLYEERDLRYKQLFEERDKRYQERFESQSEAINKAEAAQDRRLDAVNEFRGQLSDQANTFVPREVYEAAMIATRVERDLIRERLGFLEGEIRAARRASAAYVTAVGLVLGVLTLALQLFR